MKKSHVCFFRDWSTYKLVFRKLATQFMKREKKSKTCTLAVAILAVKPLMSTFKIASLIYKDIDNRNKRMRPD